jgi:hypothetical protein
MGSLPISYDKLRETLIAVHVGVEISKINRGPAVTILQIRQFAAVGEFAQRT